MKTINVSLYSFSELSGQAKDRAINEHEQFLCSVGFDCENEAGVMVTEYPEELDEETVIDSIEANEYLFYSDGTLARAITYTKTGITEVSLFGEVHTV
jgi:hypothetical protein